MNPATFKVGSFIFSFSELIGYKYKPNLQLQRWNFSYKVVSNLFAEAEA